MLPFISSVSATQGGSKGHVLTVKGTGFSPNVTDYACSIAGETCTVAYTGPTELSVTVPLKSAGNTDFGKIVKDVSDTSTQVNGFLRGNGASYQRYDR